MAAAKSTTVNAGAVLLPAAYSAHGPLAAGASYTNALQVTVPLHPGLAAGSNNVILGAEGIANAATGTVRRNSPAINGVEVSLAASDVAEVRVPPSLSLSNGQISATLSVHSVADGAGDRPKIVMGSTPAEGTCHRQQRG